MAEIEASINGVLLDDLPVTADVMAPIAARRMGAMALFGEKYGERVRVVSIGDWSRETRASARTRPFKASDRSASSPSARHPSARAFAVEALVGADAYTVISASARRRSSAWIETLNVRRDEPARPHRGPVVLKDAEREIAAVKQGQEVRCRTRSRRERARTSAVSPSSATTGLDVRAEDLRALVLDVRSRSAATDRSWCSWRRWPAVDRSSSSRPTSGRVARASRPAPTSASRLRCWAAAVAARTTSPRAVGSGPVSCLDALGAVENELRTRGA